jgi:DNA-3-methyladenine glycosylase II
MPALNAPKNPMTRGERRVLKTDPVMAALIDAVGPCRIDWRPERAPFETLARAIAHQQLHAVAAERILERFVALFTGVAFPEPHHLLAVSDAQLRSVGFSHAKVAALKDLAAKTMAAIVPAAIEFDALTDQEIVERISAVRGIGRWTVEMMLIFQLRRPDVLPVDDFGVRNGFRLAYGLKGMPTPRALEAFGERWKPYRSSAAWYLWRAVELAQKGQLPPCDPPPRVALVTARVAHKKSKARTKAKKTAAKRVGVALSMRKRAAKGPRR